MKKWLIVGGILYLLFVVAAVLTIMWLFGSPSGNSDGASRTLASSSPRGAYYTDMAISPDWQVMALGTLDEGAQVWSITDDKMLYETEPGRVETVAISPDGQKLALFWKSEDESAFRIELRQLSDGTLLRTLDDQEEWVSSVAFSSDGQTLAVGANEKVQLYDVRDGKRLRTMTGDAWEVVVSPDGKLVAAGGDPINVWRLEDGTLLNTVAGWHYMTFSPDSKKLATVASVNGAVVSMWDPSTGSRLGTLQTPPSGAGQIHSLAISPDGRMLAAGTNDYKVHLWDISTGNLQRTIGLGTNNGGEGVEFSPDGRTLAVQMNYKVQMWNIDK